MMCRVPRDLSPPNDEGRRQGERWTRVADQKRPQRQTDSTNKGGRACLYVAEGRSTLRRLELLACRGHTSSAPAELMTQMLARPMWDRRLRSNLVRRGRLLLATIIHGRAKTSCLSVHDLYDSRHPTGVSVKSHI